MKQKGSFSPKTLQGLLIFAFLLVIAGGVGICYLGINKIKDTAVEVNHAAADAEASELQISQLQILRNQIQQGSSLVEKADKLFSTEATYQSQVLSDLRAYANKTGVRIASTNFEESSEPNKHTVTVKLQSPASYSGLIRFLDAIEGNVPKLQIAAIKLSHPKGGTADTVAVDDIKLEVTTK